MTTPRKSKMHVLIVDDDISATQRVGKLLQSKGFHVHAATNPEQAMETLSEYPLDAVLVDVQLHPDNLGVGSTLIEKLRHRRPSLPLVGISSYLTAYEPRKSDDLIPRLKIPIIAKDEEARFVDELVSRIRESKQAEPQSLAQQPTVDVIGVGRLLGERLAHEPALVHGLSPEEFEELICDRLSAMGLDARRVGGTYHKDGGIDIVFWPTSSGFPFLGAAQVRHHRTQRMKEGVGSVRDFAGAIAGQPFGAGIIVTNTSFTADAQWFARERAKFDSST